ncbi:MAG TPA: M23 family metallopeptidase [Gemmatimonadaceae bacterium]|jgi:murein DD-endopeptidase MepM/ murein hydrolase activator NlpD|nr:M23 family metallopeptidase [Gemmatimonadaceae bacterium]
MRNTIWLSIGVLIAGAACSRPVLYYPSPAVARAGSEPHPVLAGAPAVPAATALPANAAAMTDVEYLAARHLVVPVAGADMSKVEDTYLEERDGGERTHRAIDILAPRDTPILSADDGRILRMSTNSLGGITMYTVDPLNRLVYYYAHMDHYNTAMSVGRMISRGDTLGYVGTTGNAPKDTPHLHFQIMRWPADGKYWNGEPIDPFEFLGGVRRDRVHHDGPQPVNF